MGQGIETENGEVAVIGKLYSYAPIVMKMNVKHKQFDSLYSVAEP